jgi:type IV secretory pathway VirJ component
LRTPEEAAVALGRAIEATLERYKADRIIVVGYSFGADVGPFLFNRLAPELRQRVDRIALISPSKEAPFQVTIAERVGLASPGAHPVAPELERASASGGKILCLYGERDSDSICPTTHLLNMRSIKLKGGHGLAGDHQAVAAAILEAWKE